MPEESFEQQARNMAEPFSMEPQPVVWQRVEAALTRKRKRRAAFVWWLLPLCIACGLGFWRMKDGKISSQNKTFANQATTAKRNILKQNNNEKEDEKSTQKNSKKRDAASPQRKLQIPTAKADCFVENKKLKAKEKEAKSIKEMALIQLQSTLFAGKKAKEKVVQNKNEATSTQPQAHLFSDKNAVVDSSTMDLQNHTNNKMDTVKTNATIVAKTNDSLKQNKDSSTVAGNKKQKKSKWQTGVVAEAGASWLGNGLFFNKSSTSNDVFSSNPSANPGSGTVTNYLQHQKTGVDAALGISVQRNIVKRLFFAGHVVYHYQQFSIQTTITNQSQTALNGNLVNGSASYRLQFANLYAGIGFTFFHNKNSSVALQTGIDNSWLFSVKRKQNDTLKILTTQGFQRWQPLVAIAIPVRFYTQRTTRWQLSPFVRWGLRSLQKNNASYQHRPLNSAGIQAIYFFK